jgi:alkanesulfonate monooxygenase SsuD/methylene tetrahydromethanopterin reductase-like flavin-dependent oxidoreductase (luciferase family)
LQLAINCHFYAADSAAQAREEFFPTYEKLMNKIGRERGWQPLTRRQFDQMCAPEGPLLVGDTQEIIDKILYHRQLFSNTRFLAQLIKGALTHEQVMHSIELLGRVIAPAVRGELKGQGYE